MTDMQYVKIAPLPTGQTSCPKCGNPMGLTRIEPDSPGKDLRTCECGQCQHIETMVIAFAKTAQLAVLTRGAVSHIGVGELQKGTSVGQLGGPEQIERNKQKADDMTSRGQTDSARVINAYEEVRYWCKEFGCTEKELFDAVDAAGTISERVGAYFAKIRAREKQLAGRRRSHPHRW